MQICFVSVKMRNMKVSRLCTALVMLTMCLSTSATYISWNKKPTTGSNRARVHHKSNHIDRASIKRKGPSFKHDWDIQRYLKIYGMDMMIWRCKNAIQPNWNWKPLPLVELYCEAIGTMKSVEWSHNFQKIDLTEKRYGQAIVPHFSNGLYYSRWIDFRLKIYNATMNDSGMYSFKVTSTNGNTRQQYIYVDISEKKKKRRGHKKRRNKKRERNLNNIRA